MTTVQWTRVAVQDMHDIAVGRAEGSAERAESFVEPVDRAVRQLRENPHSGRIVPELERHGVTRDREIVLSPCRLTRE
ncbi:MAG: type II toxin-antitoxin system RelE/ParE family toxin [Spirochaetes bacterium]|nr:type II toxin-antitoxin system RelE/ParE family toxin [Spirochaetota bacterium]